MPFSYPPAASSRVRRGKDKDKDKDVRSSNSTTSSGSSKSHRRPSRSSDHSPPRSPLAVAPSLYTQQNITLDKLPPLPESGATSPSSVTSRFHPRSPTHSTFAVFEDPSESTIVRSIPPPPTVEEEISELDLTPFRAEDSLQDAAILAVSLPGTEDPNPAGSPIHHRTKPAVTQLSAPQAASFPASVREDLEETKAPPDSSFFPSQSQRQLTAASPYSSPLQPSSHLYRTSSDVRPTSPPFHNYLQNQFFSPPAAFYYPMAYPNSLPPHMQPFSPSAHPSFAGFGTPQGSFPTIPMQSPPLQRQGSLGPAASNVGDPFGGPPPLPPPLSASSAEVALMASAGGSASGEDDASELLHRIQSAIPDLHQLLNRYRETSGQLGMREELIRKAEAQQADALKQKEYYIDSLCKQLEITAHKHSAESSKLRLEIGNLEEKTRELTDSLAATEKSRSEVEEAKKALEREIADLEKRSAEERDALQHEFEAWKSDTIREFGTQKKSMEDDFERRRKEQEDSFQGLNAEISSKFLKEKEAMRYAWGRQKRDLETNYDKLRKELESKLSAKSKELETARCKEHDYRENWAKEREALVKSWDEERAGMGKGWEEQRQILVKQHRMEMEDMQKRWKQLEAEAARKATEERVAVEREKEALRKGWDADKEKFDGIIRELQAVTDTLDTEKRRLQKMVETFGEATDLRSKGDTYFIDAFGQLRKQIVQLSEEHFQNLPIAPPDDILARVPPDIPSFLANTEASRRVRQAYIQHVVSSVLTYRIFHPFLFTLGRRYDRADILFQDMSTKLRHKSTRREAVWRQHTLHAAYSVSSAKQSINKVATVIIDEIVNQIKYFADPKHLEKITTAVRRIVKIAAETWRYARLERELISAKLPAAEDSEEPLNEWSEGDGYDQSKADQLPSREGEPRRVLLRLLPVVFREPTHEDLRDDTKVDNNGCIFSHGVALFSDSPPVVARIQELQHRGFERPVSAGDLGMVEQPRTYTQSNRGVPPNQSARGSSIPTTSALPLTISEGNIIDKLGAQISESKDIVQPGGNLQTQGENRSESSVCQDHFTGRESSERTNPGSSQDTFDNRPPFNPKSAKGDPVPDWGTSGVRLPGDSDGW
ncbi:MAG: hypothetical protein M1830_008428 [Pleopsidium flavum]|nr:MAG: hypothetical protein M1830_008428 [Pleopsidium flavum]